MMKAGQSTHMFYSIHHLILELVLLYFKSSTAKVDSEVILYIYMLGN
jgi:hypothetical protein